MSRVPDDDQAFNAKAEAAIAGLVALARDPTSLNETFFRDLVNALPAAIYTTDVAGAITYFNEAAAALWGFRPTLGESKWCGSWKLFWPDGRALPHDQCPMAIALKEERPVRGYEAVAERPDGIRIPFIPFPTPLYNSSGVMVGAVNMLIDITDRKRSEQDAQRLAAIIESSGDAIISKDLNGIITSWNTAAERIFGYMAEEAIGKSILILIPPQYQEEETRIIDRVRRGQRVEHYETVRQRKHGGLVEISLTVSPIKNADGKIIGASKIARDISERKRTEAQMLHLAREAEHRTKNILATVQAAVRLSNSDTVEDFKKAVFGRIDALAKVHALFVQSRWSGAELRSLVEQELSPYCQSENARLQIEGTRIMLETNTAQAIAISMHELATNAAKYGALSGPDGTLQVSWKRAPDGRLVLRWAEAGGPAVTPPKRQGFGMRVMEAMIRDQLSGDLRFDWRPGGIVCEITLPALAG
jgi:two-component system CheB/CheR fusion protein